MANISCDSKHTTNDNKKAFKAKPIEVSFDESICLLPSNLNSNIDSNKTNEFSNRNSCLSETITISSNKTVNNQNNRRAKSPPDGGWGWVVVFASFMINLISDGISLSFGIIFIELVEHFGESKSKTAWVGSLFLSIPLITGPIASALTDHYGCRRVAICGSIMASTGFIAGQMATRIEHLFIAFSFSGLGLALCYVTSIVSVAYYFERRRSLATGLAVCGSGFGTFLFAPLTIYLLKEYGWRGTLLILGAVFLNIVNFGALMRDLDLNISNDETNEDINTEDIERADTNCDNNCFSNPLVVNNKTINKICSEDQSNEAELPTAPVSRLCSSLIHIPTYIRHNDVNNVSHEVITELTLKKGGTLRRLLQRYPKLVAFFMPQEYQNYDNNHKNPQNFVALSPSIKTSKVDNIVIEPKNNFIKSSNTSNRRELNSEIKHSFGPTAELSPLSSNFLRNLRLQRGSLTYRSAMLNIKKYRLRASSAPDIYRNSMVAIHEKSGFLYDLKEVFEDMIDLSNLKSFRYCLFCFSNFLLYVCIDVPYVYLPDQAVLRGVDSDSASYLISIIGILNTLGVVLVGYFGDKQWIDSSLLYSLFVAISGLSLAIMPWIHNYLGIALMAALYGFTISANYALVSVILVNLISLDSFTNAYGLLLLAQGFGSLIGPPFAGWLFDYFGDYNIAFHLTGVCIFISGALVVPIARSSNCLTIEDDSTEVTESSRPVSPKIDDSTHSFSDSHETHDKGLKTTSFDLKDPNLIPINKSSKIDNTFNKNVLLSKSFDNVNKSIIN